MVDDDNIVEELELEEEKPKEEKSNRPDLVILQPDISKEGKKILKRVGGMWIRKTKDGKEFYSILIGNLRLLAFKNEQKS
ncbi:MAG: hypothetical protein N3E37_02570 [Candidatus Micrarchaeota archaeon]|nr:hypothetical protein [Candidatus Micrarchaeota archaeon]